jgi:hypothetical protein
MNVLRNYVVAIMLMLVMILAGCGENVDPSKADLKIVMKATTESGTLSPGGRVAEANLEFTEARIGITEIEFEAEGESDDYDDEGEYEYEFEIEFEGQFEVDLLAGTSDPDFGIADLMPGKYTEIEVEMGPVMDDGNSLFIAFNYQKDGEDPISVEISTKRALEFEIEKYSGIDLDGNTLNQILILFDLDKILAGVDLSMAEVNDGVIRINDTTNTSFAATILKNFYDSCDAGEDDDGDDKFDDDTTMMTTMTTIKKKFL